MQAYPQPQPSAQNITPPQNMTPQKPWWLIYGLGFGLGVVVFNFIYYFIYYYGMEALFRSWAYSTLSGIVSNLLSIFFFLCFFAACLVAGILAARKTRRAGSATLASLLVGLGFFLSELILQYVGMIGVRYVAIAYTYRYLGLEVFPVACLGVYVGFIGGLIGRSTESTRRMIGIFYAIGVIFSCITFVSFVDNYLYFFYGPFIFYGFGLILLALGGLCSMVAWIMTLIQYAKVQSWGAFTLTFFFSGIMVLVYLIVGVLPQQPAQYVVLQPGAYAPGAVAYQPMQPAPAQPSQPDAISILQQRFARGEITEETYRQMFATLTNQPANPPQP